MATVEKPTSYLGLIRLLSNILLTGNQDIAAGNLYVLQATLDAIGIFLPDFIASQRRVSEKYEIKLKEVREKGEKLDELEGGCRDLFEGVKRRQKRLKQPLEILAYYGLPLDGTIPHPDIQAKWFDISEAAIAGDARAVAAGNPPILNPSAPDLQILLDAAKADFADYAMADREHDQAQAALAEMRPQAEEFIDDVYKQLGFNLRKLTNPSQRRVMRTYGYKFVYSPGEPPEEVPAAPSGLVIDFVRPNMTVSCDAVDTTTDYQFVYSEDDVNWTELYAGADNSYTYQPPAGRRVYKVRASNEYGYGEWSEDVEYTVDEVPA